MYTVLHRYISTLYYNMFQREFKSSPVYNNSFLRTPLDFMKSENDDNEPTSRNIFKLGFSKFNSSDLFGYNDKISRFDYRYVKQYYEENKDKFIFAGKRGPFVENALSPFFKYGSGDLARYVTLYSVEEIEKLREYVYGILDKGRIEPYNDQYKEMFFYTALFGLFPEIFMGTPLAYYSVELPIDLFKNFDATSTGVVVLDSESIDYKVFEFTSKAIVSRFEEIYRLVKNEGSPRGHMLQTVTAFSHAIYRLHLVNNFLLIALNQNFTRVDGLVKRAMDIFKKYVLTKLSEKYAFAIERLVKYHNLTLQEIQYMVLQDVIDYLQLLGLTLSFIGRVPDDKRYRTGQKGSGKAVLISKFDVNLWDFSSKFVDKLDEPFEFYQDFFSRVLNIAVNDDESLALAKFYIGSIFKSSKYAGFHMLLNDCFLPAPEGDLDFCRELVIPREMLEVYVQKFEAGILYSMNSIYLPEYSDFTKLLPDSLYEHLPRYKEKKIYPATYPLMTPYAVMFIDTVKNGMLMFNGYKDKYPDLWDRMVGKGEYLKAKLNDLIIPWMAPSNLKSFVPPPPNLIGSDIVLLNDFVKAVLHTNYDKISEEGKKEFYSFFEDLKLIPRKNEVAHAIHMKYDPENFVDRYLDYVYLNPISCGVTPSGREEMILERQQKLEEKRKNITDKIRDSIESDNTIGISIDIEEVKKRSKQVETQTDYFGRKIGEKYNLDYYNLETIISDSLETMKADTIKQTVEQEIQETIVTNITESETVSSTISDLDRSVAQTTLSTNSISLPHITEEEKENSSIATSTTVDNESAISNVISIEVTDNKEDIMINEVNDRISKLESEVERISNSVTNLEKAIQSLVESISQTNSKLDNIVTSIQQSIQQLGIKTSDHEIRISTMENEIERLRKRVDTLEKKESKEDIVVGRIEEEKVDEIPTSTTNNSNNQPSVIHGHNINLSGATVHGNVVINIGAVKHETETTQPDIKENEHNDVDNNTKPVNEEVRSEIPTNQLLDNSVYEKLVEDVTSKVTERIIIEFDKAITRSLTTTSNQLRIDDKVVDDILDTIRSEVVTKHDFEMKVTYLDTGINALLETVGKLEILVSDLISKVSTIPSNLVNQTDQILETEEQVNNYESNSSYNKHLQRHQSSQEQVIQDSNESDNNIMNGFIPPKVTGSSDIVSKLDDVFLNLDSGLDKTMKIISDEFSQNDEENIQGFV